MKAGWITSPKKEEERDEWESVGRKHTFLLCALLPPSFDALQPTPMISSMSLVASTLVLASSISPLTLERWNLLDRLS